MSETAAMRPVHAKKRKVLLVHCIGPHRNLRASIMRKIGFEVVCAADCAEARMLWHPAVYDLVLLDGSPAVGAANEELCRDIKSAYPDERFAFLVGKPELLALNPAVNAGNNGAKRSKSYERLFKELLTEACELLPHRHGFMEAVWRMYLIRSTQPSSTSKAPVSAAPLNREVNIKPRISFGDAVREVELETGSAP